MGFDRNTLERELFDCFKCWTDLDLYSRIDIWMKMSWFDKILISTLGGYMAYVFVLATINTICDCI